MKNAGLENDGPNGRTTEKYSHLIALHFQRRYVVKTVDGAKEPLANKLLFYAPAVMQDEQNCLDADRQAGRRG